ncbi:MAG: hypothetical protein JWL62_1130, partial [Hyphomicrobiales bacterium]|nr:hypothetical protein [Hyphomicrobiales bacterium]
VGQGFLFAKAIPAADAMHYICASKATFNKVA